MHLINTKIKQVLSKLKKILNLHDFLSKGGLLVIFVIAGMTTLICLIGMVFTHPTTNFWAWVIFFDIPFFGFIIWATYFGIYKFIKRNKKIFKDALFLEE